MQKISTPSIQTDLNSSKTSNKKAEMQPKEETIKSILAYASVYQATKVSDNQFIQLIVN